LNQPEWLTTKSIEEYVQAAVRLIDDSELRVHISRNILEKNPAGEFFTEKVDSENFAIIFKNMYLQHEYIKCSENKVFPYEKFSTDLTALK
jgi:predicted O-linked N-acetylglucosamine transferase (SPINDLY family)